MDRKRQFYAHTKEGANGEILPEEYWEPLFTEGCPTVTGSGDDHCEACESLHPRHGHLNKVAFWSAKFAAAMFPADSPESKAASEWARLAGLWHDLGKFAPEWQTYLTSKADPHTAEITGKVDHSTAGAQHAAKAIQTLGHLIAYGIAGHHSGLLDATSNGACQAHRLGKKKTWRRSRGFQPRSRPKSPPNSLPTLRTAFSTASLLLSSAVWFFHASSMPISSPPRRS